MYTHVAFHGEFATLFILLCECGRPTDDDRRSRKCRVCHSMRESRGFGSVTMKMEPGKTTVIKAGTRPQPERKIA
ncbi:hypothetical protein M378DRAFT_170953 [Amanita muscaria Koide BX008]|uniref:Uncharacterized protein n=1 Tax=Amanita muscaria (strain Koide BX008) TaxID=946122 RepID=A0A0C2WA92_AMAMK|nr:hypothetical protein M378DRAFT_170953 [Amanita muscaria Koide BX008]